MEEVYQRRNAVQAGVAGIRSALGKRGIAAPVALLESIMQLPVGDLTIYSNAPHMHLLGTRIVTSVGDKTLLDIPRWDFHWQLFYFYEQPYDFDRRLRLLCSRGNGAADLERQRLWPSARTRPDGAVHA